MSDIKKLKRLLREYEDIIGNYLEGYHYKATTDDSFVYINERWDESEVTLVGETIKIQKTKDNISHQIIINLPNKDNRTVECEEKIIEDRENGIIFEKISRVYDYTIFSKDTRYLTDITSRRYILAGDDYLPHLSNEEKLSEIASLKTVFSSHMKTILFDGSRLYTDTPASTKTYLNGNDISRVYDIVEGPNKIEKIYDLYNGKVTEDNSYDLISINLGLLPKDAYAYREKAGIVAAEDNLIGKGSKEVSEKYKRFVMNFFKKKIHYPYDFDLTNREEFIKAIDYSPKAVDVCKANLERMLGISYQEFDNLDFDAQQKIIKEARAKNKITERESDTITMMIGSGEHAIFTRVKRGKRILVGSGEHSYFIEAGLTPEEEKRRLNDEIDSILNSKKSKVKEKVKSIINRITGN